MWTMITRDRRLDFHGNPDHHLESSMGFGGGCNLRVFLFKLKHAVVYADDMYLSYKTLKKTRPLLQQLSSAVESVIMEN